MGEGCWRKVITREVHGRNIGKRRGGYWGRIWGEYWEKEGGLLGKDMGVTEEGYGGYWARSETTGEGYEGYWGWIRGYQALFFQGMSPSRVGPRAPQGDNFGMEG